MCIYTLFVCRCSVNWLESAFVIDVLKYDVPDLYKEYMNGYAAQLMYGRFDYIKEEF